MTFSVAKPFAALAVLDAVAEGHLGLDQPVSSVWPAYGQGGKERHDDATPAGPPGRAPGLSRGGARVEYDDREALVDLLAAAAPVHAPGDGVAEHALTYGHLLDEVLRRATGEPLAERFARIAAAAGWDLHLRVEASDWRGWRPSWSPRAWRTDYLRTRGGARRWAGRRGCSTPEVLNSARFRGTPFPAVALHASALSLASFYDD